MCVSKYILLICLLICLFIFYFQINLSKKENMSIDTNPKKYTLAIVSIFKNEQDYMEEWLDYHIAQGFDQIYLYSNDPDISKYEYLLNPKYVGYITLINWINKQNYNSNTIQRQAYQDCVKNYSHMCQFLLLLDLDEFVHPIKSFSTTKEYINSLKPFWNKIQCFKIQRFNFGSNGHKTKPIIPVTQAYTKHEKICSTYKTLANTDYIDKNAQFYGVHDFPYISNKNNENNAKIYNSYLSYEKTGFPCGCENDNINEIPLVINHYYTKSYNEYIERCKLWKNGGINPIGFRENCEKEFENKNVNEVEGF